MHTGNAECYITPLLALESTQAYYSFVRSLFFSHSLDCISCSYEEICDAPVGTASWSPAKKRNGFKEVHVFGGPSGYRHNPICAGVSKNINIHKQWRERIFYIYNFDSTTGFKMV